MSVAQRSRAADMIARKGQTVAIVGGSGGTYNPATATAAPAAYSKSAKAVVLPLSPFRKSQDGIRQGDEQLLLSGLDTSGAALAMPPINAVVTLADGTTKGTLIAVERLNPEGDGVILFDAIIRGNVA